MREEGDTSRQCTAHSASGSGKRCGSSAMMGQNVCRMHGGATPVAMKAAKMRLLALVEPAMAGLLRVLECRGACTHCGRSDDMSVVVRAAQVVLDRTGFGPTSKVEVTHSEERFDEMSNEELAAEAARLSEEFKAESVH